jgi:predicted transcriptional regulator
MIEKISFDIAGKNNEALPNYKPSKNRGISEASFFESMSNLIKSFNDKIEEINKEFESLRDENRKLREAIENHAGEICHYL